MLDRASWLAVESLRCETNIGLPHSLRERSPYLDPFFSSSTSFVSIKIVHGWKLFNEWEKK